MGLPKSDGPCWAVGAHTFNPTSQEAEAGGSLCVPGEPGLQELAPGQAPKLWRNPVSTKQNTKEGWPVGIL